jgi:hypothetical protein
VGYEVADHIKGKASVDHELPLGVPKPPDTAARFKKGGQFLAKAGYRGSVQIKAQEVAIAD